MILKRQKLGDFSCSMEFSSCEFLNYLRSYLSAANVTEGSGKEKQYW